MLLHEWFAQPLTKVVKPFESAIDIQSINPAQGTLLAHIMIKAAHKLVSDKRIPSIVLAGSHTKLLETSYRIIVSKKWVFDI
jgi:hypothetical protein